MDKNVLDRTKDQQASQSREVLNRALMKDKAAQCGAHLESLHTHACARSHDKQGRLEFRVILDHIVSSAKATRPCIY